MSNKDVKIENWEDAFRLIPPLLDKFNEDHKEVEFHFVDLGYYYEELHAIRIQFDFKNSEREFAIYLIDNSNMTTNKFMKVVKGLYEEHKKENN